MSKKQKIVKKDKPSKPIRKEDTVNPDPPPPPPPKQQ